MVAKGLVKRLQSGDVRENEYRETDDLTTRCVNKEQQFSRGVLLIVRATARARGEDRRRRRRGSESVFASETQTERSCVLPPSSREREKNINKHARTKSISQTYTTTFLKVHNLYSNRSAFVVRRRASECLTRNLNASHAFRVQFSRDSCSSSRRNVYRCA